MKEQAKMPRNHAPDGLWRRAVRRAVIAGCAWIIALLPVNPAAAEAWIIGIGFNDFTQLDPRDRAVGNIEYQSDVITTRWGVDTSLVLAVSTHANRDIWAGVGVAAYYPLRNQWFVEGSVMPGYYYYDDPQTDIGSRFEIRSLIGIGRQISDRTALSLAITHKSNAGTSDVNPGVNVLMMRLRYAF